MKVLLISHYPPPSGGIASWTKRLLKIGLPNGWEIVHINSNTIGDRDPFKNTKVSIRDEFVRTTTIWKKERKALKDKDVKVVHTCIPCTPFGMVRETITAIIAKAHARKFILHCRCTIPNVVNRKWKKIIFRILSSFCDEIMTLNQKSHDFASAICNCQVSLIPNFVSNDEILPDDELIVKSEIKNAVYIGGVTSDKGCDTIIMAAGSLPHITFHLVGNVSNEIRNMEIAPNLILYGNQDKEFIKDILKKCDVFLFLSRFWGEGFSNALVEAMSAGLPCIVSDWAANADMIEDKGGFVIPVNDAEGLKGAISKLKDDRILRTSMGKWNIQKVKTQYSESEITARYVKEYEKLCR